MHSTPARKTQGSQNEFQPLGEEIFLPIVDKNKVPMVHSDHNYSLDSKTNKLGQSSGKFIDLGDKHSMSTDYPEQSLVDAGRSINSEQQSAALVDYPALDGADRMDQLQSNIVDGNNEPERQISDDSHSSGTEEIDVDNCVSDGFGEAEQNEDPENLDDGQRILPSDDGVIACEQTEDGKCAEDVQKILPTEDGYIADLNKTIDPDMTIDPNATIDAMAAEEGNEIKNNDAEEDLHDQRHGETNSENVIEDTEKGSTPKRRRLGIFGPKCKRQKVSVKLQDLSVDLAMPLNKDDVFNVQKEQESEENFIVQYCCNKCQQRTFTIEGYETHLLHAHQIRNADKYPPTLLWKTFKSPESLHLDSVSSSNNDSQENIEKESENEETRMDTVTEEPTSPNNDDIDNPDESEIEQGEKNTEENAEQNEDQSSKEDVADNPEKSSNETTESAEPALMDSIQSEPLMFPHFSEQFQNHPDKPTVQCPECPQKFFYEGGLRHHLETHKSTRDKPIFQCPECPNVFYYQSGLDHHYETHVHQKRRESGLYSDEENNRTTIDPVPKGNKGRGKKRTIAENTGEDVVTKHEKKSVDSAIEAEKDLQSLNSTENGDAKKESMNSASKPKRKRGQGRPRKSNPLPRRHRGKEIKTESDLNTSEDSERQRDIEQGIAALERLKQKKKDHEAAIFASLRTKHQLRSGCDLNKTDRNEENADKETTNNKTTEQPDEDKSKQGSR